MRRRKGALVQCNSRKFQLANPLFQQQTVLYTISFLKCSSPSTCMNLYIGFFFLMKHPTYVLSFVSTQTCLLNTCGFSIFCLTEFLCIKTSECCFLIPFVLDIKKKILMSLSYSIKRCPFASFFPTSHIF